MIEEGIYRIYILRHEGERTHRRMAARLLIHGGQIHHLEDHHQMDSLFPEGPLTPQLQLRLARLQQNPYYEVIHENDIAAGHHPQELPTLDLGHSESEHKFIMTGDGITHPAMVEMWDDVIEVDGRRLDDTEAHHLLTEVAAGRVVMTPIE